MRRRRSSNSHGGVRSAARINAGEAPWRGTAFVRRSQRVRFPSPAPNRMPSGLHCKRSSWHSLSVRSRTPEPHGDLGGVGREQGTADGERWHDPLAHRSRPLEVPLAPIVYWKDSPVLSRETRVQIPLGVPIGESPSGRAPASGAGTSGVRFSPLRPWVCSSAARTPASHAGYRRFESSQDPLHAGDS